MDNIVDLKQYKKAKIVSKDLEQIIRILELTTQGLGKYSKYTHVMEILSQIQQKKIILKVYLDKCNALIDKKK